MCNRVPSLARLITPASRRNNHLECADLSALWSLRPFGVRRPVGALVAAAIWSAPTCRRFGCCSHLECADLSALWLLRTESGDRSPHSKNCHQASHFPFIASEVLTPDNRNSLEVPNVRKFAQTLRARTYLCHRHHGQHRPRRRNTQ